MPVIFSGYFILKQLSIRESMEERLESEALEEFTFPVSELVWLKPQKEILLNGKHFDIKTYKINGDRVSVKGLFDEKEQKLKLLLAVDLEETEEGTNIMHGIFLTYYFHNRTSGTVYFYQPAPDFAEYIGTTTLEPCIPIIAPPPRFS